MVVLASNSSPTSRRKRPWTVLALLVLPSAALTTPVHDRTSDGSALHPEQHAAAEPEQQQQRLTSPERLPPVRKQQLSPESYTRTATSTSKQESVEDKKYQDFLLWCHQLLGIDTLLQVQSFTYPNYMQAHYVNHWALLEEADEDEVAVEQLERISVRGLAAKRDIAIGEVVISIPLHAIISVPTTIDHDPVLSRVMGKKERDRFGWNDEYFQLPLLTVAILHHVHTLGPQSPISRYIQILTSTAMDHMPILWNRTRLKQETTEGVYTIARGIQKDIEEMYDAVVPILLREHPTVFTASVLTLQEFTWAFALVNSRHWHLPVPEDMVPVKNQQRQDEFITAVRNNEETHLSPPANKPTEEWVSNNQHGNDDAVMNTSITSKSPGHSFLAPLADLLNFGPPCTRGKYSADAFELVATCNYQKGQEVTFWYSDDCDDVMIANYGFSHPIIPSCMIRDKKSSRYKERIQALELEVDHAYDDLEKLDRELERVEKLLKQCHCEEDHHETMTSSRKRAVATTKLRQEARSITATISSKEEEDGQRHGVRRPWRSDKKSDL